MTPPGWYSEVVPYSRSELRGKRIKGGRRAFRAEAGRLTKVTAVNRPNKIQRLGRRPFAHICVRKTVVEDWPRHP